MKRFKTIILEITLFLQLTAAFSPTASIARPISLSRQSSSSSSSSSTTENSTNEVLKKKLLDKISTLNQLQSEDGKIAIDFGVKGGEIDKKSRAPRKLDFYTVSERVGKAADEVFGVVDELSKVNPTEEATAGFGSKEQKQAAPLDGVWQLLFSTAADANFSKDSKRGDAKAMNIVNAEKEQITNVIKFAPKEDGKPKAVEELRVKLSAKAEGPNKVDLVFKYVAVQFTKLFFIPLRWKLYIPVPAPTISKFVVAIRNIKRFLFRQKKEVFKLPKAFFDVLYLDKDLRVHKTGENNIFIQARPEWKLAWETATV